MKIFLVMPSVHKMVKHKWKIWQQMMQGFYLVSDHFVDTGIIGLKSNVKRT